MCIRDSVFSGSGLRTDFVGHPLVDPLRAARARIDRAAARKTLGVADAEPLVLLLPGSRHNELRYGLPLQLAVAEAVRVRVPEARFALAVAPTLRARRRGDRGEPRARHGRH